ncbi:MAG: flagellar FlbD family protein [Myxococcaceae bacterium]
MILLTRLDGARVVVNEDLIVFADCTPDTVLTLSGGQRLMVKESLDQVVERSAQYRRRSTLTVIPTGATVIEGKD